MTTEPGARARKPSPERISETMLELAAARGADKTIDPAEVARALAGPSPDAWGRVMTDVRRVAIRLMKEGRIVVLRKGKPVDPDDFRGVYRLRLAVEGEAGSIGDGSSASERPDSQ
jgi:hypothetical protein